MGRAGPSLFLRTGGKMFKAGRGARLNPSDLRRFGRRFESDLEALMPGRNCRLVALSDWGPDDTWLVDDSLLLPIVFKGRDLGYLQISPSVPGDDEEFIAELIRQGLEAMRLRKALLTDRETGLFSRDYFSGRLLRALRRRRRQGAAMSLSLDEEISPELILVMAELREAPEPHLALPQFAARLNQHLNLKCPARSGVRQLAFLAEGKPDEIRLSLEAALDEQVEAAGATRPVAAWVRWPYDLGREEGDGPGQLRLQARKLWEMAETALFYARQSRGSAVGVAFGDLVDHYGQITQVLPMDRVIINLGRSTGATPGQVFLVSSPAERPSVEPQYKGEVTVFEIQESYSLARVSGLKTPLRLVAGDRLSFSRNEYDPLAGPAPGPDRVLPGFLAQLPEREDLLARLAEIGSKPLALALARFDGFDKTCSLMGREEADKALAFVFEKVAGALPATEIKSLCLPDTLALAWPDLVEDELKPIVQALAAELREVNPVSFGLLFSPGEEGEAEWLISDARKALHEAAFYGSGQLAVFGPLALNISGDRLFESGDIDGAINEYERGLEINPDDLNLLNSLGVCYGRLGSSAAAMDIFEKVIALDSGNMMAHYNLGYTHLLGGRMQEAEEVLNRAAELAPDNFETLYHFGKTALELGHLDSALAALKKAADLENGRPGVHRLLGEAMMLAGDHQGALSAFKKAVKATPNDAYALSTLGVLFVDQANDLPVARSLFLKSVEVDPTNSLYRQRLGRLLFSLGEFGEAEHHLKMAVEYGGHSPELNYQLGCLAEDNGRNDEALAYFKAALEEDPGYQPALEKAVSIG